MGPQNVLFPLNGAVEPKTWSVVGTSGTWIGYGTAPYSMRAIDYFYWILHEENLGHVVNMTNESLAEKSCTSASCGELLIFFSTQLLMTRMRVSNRHGLWKESSAYEYVAAPYFGRFISWDRLEAIRANIKYSFQPSERGNLSSEKFRWMPCEEFMESISEHRRNRVNPVSILCVDEPISRWYGVGGSWLEYGLTFYADLDQKPESWCEIQNLSCGFSGMMLNICFFKSQGERKSLYPIGPKYCWS